MEVSRLFALLILILVSAPVFAIQQRPVWATGGVMVTANPSEVSFAVGSSATTQITLASTGGFAGSVSLVGYSFPYQALNVTLNPTVVTLIGGGTATATATVSGNSTTTPYKYQIDVDASGTYGQATGVFNATVTPGPATVPDFRLSSSLTVIPVPATGSTTVTISIASLAGFAGDINLSNPIPLGNLNTTTIHLRSGQIANATLTLTGDCPFASPNLRSTLEIDAKSGARFHWIAPVYFYQALTPTFCFSSVTTQRAVIGSSLSNDLTFGAFDGFDANVLMSAQYILPTAVFPSNDIRVHQGVLYAGYVLLAITVPINTAPANYTIIITGRSGSLSWVENETVQAVTGPYFTMTVSPTALSIPQGATRNLVISMTGQGNFQNHIYVYPIFSNQSLQFSEYPPSDQYVSDGQITAATIVVNASSVAPGTYELWLQAETYYLPVINAIQIIPIIVTTTGPGPDVAIIANPLGRNVVAGSTTRIQLVVAGLNGYVGNAILNCSSQNSALNCWLDNNTLLVDGKNQTITLNVATDAGMNPGNYPIVASIEAFPPGGQGMSISRSVTVVLVVTSAPVFGVSPVVLYGAIGAVAGAGAIATGSALFLQRRKRNSKVVSKLEIPENR